MDRCRKWFRKRLRSFKRRDRSAALSKRLRILSKLSSCNNNLTGNGVVAGEPANKTSSCVPPSDNKEHKEQQQRQDNSHQAPAYYPPPSVPTPPPVYKIVAVGGGAVGKSSMILQFMYDEFVEEYEPTRADSYRKRIQLDGEQVMIDILDTAGQEDYAAIRDHYLRGADGFLFVFSLSEPESMQDVIDIREQIVRVNYGREDFPCIMVGNKADLEDKRSINFDQVMRWSKLWNIRYIETSAKTKLNVDEVLYELMRLIRDHKLRSQRSFKGPEVTPFTPPNKNKVGLDGVVTSRKRVKSKMMTGWRDSELCTVM